MNNISTTKNLRFEILLIALFSVLAAIVFFAHLGNYPLFNPDEGLYAEPAREMLDTGNYITTTLNYAVRFTKPPLIIWMMVLCYKVFGINEFAARIFCAASAFLLIIVTYLFANKYLGRRIAIIATTILLTAPLFIGVGRMAITDMPLSLFIAGGLFAFFHAWKEKKTLWLYVGYLLTAFAVMTKGPVGLILPIIILATFFLLQKKANDATKFFRIPLGLLIIAIIAIPWFAIEITITHGAYFQEFIVRENFARFTTVVDAHKGPIWYHLAAVFGGLFPWSIMLPQAISTIVRNIIDTKISVSDISAKSPRSLISKCLNSCQSLTEQNEVFLFTLIWSAVTIVFFSLSVSKLLPYTLPAFPPLAIMIAYQWEMFLKTKARKNIFIYEILLTVIYLNALFLCPILLKLLRNSPPELIPIICLYCALISLWLLLSIFVLISNRKGLSLITLFASVTITTIIFIPQIICVLSQSWEQALSRYAQVARYAHKPLVVYRLRKPSLPFYYRQPVLQPNNQKALIETTKKNKQYYLVTNDKYLPEVEPLGYKIIARNNNFVFLVLLNKQPN